MSNQSCNGQIAYTADGCKCTVPDGLFEAWWRDQKKRCSGMMSFARSRMMYPANSMMFADGFWLFFVLITLFLAGWCSDFPVRLAMLIGALWIRFAVLFSTFDCFGLTFAFKFTYSVEIPGINERIIHNQELEFVHKLDSVFAILQQ